MQTKVLTMDDFGNDWEYVKNLEDIKSRIPNIKITLFTIAANDLISKNAREKSLTENVFNENGKRLIDDKRYIDWIIINKDWIEIATHGYHHHGILPTYGKGFSSVENKKSFDEQYDFMKKGLDELGRFMPKIKGYKAPGNHMNYDTLKALEHLNFQYYMWMDTIYVYDINSARQFKRYIPVGRTEVSPHIQEPNEYNHWFDIDYNNTEFLFLSEYITQITKGKI